MHLHARFFSWDRFACNAVAIFSASSLCSAKVGRFAVESFRPDMRIGPRVDQLRIDANAVAGAPHRAFQDVRHAKRNADFAQVALAATILPH